MPFLREVASSLKPSGCLIVVMPNVGSLGQEWFRADCYALDAPRHLVLYTTAGVRRLVQQVPELRLTALRTHAGRARRVFTQCRIVRKSGSFLTPGVTLTPVEKLGAFLFARMESLATVLAPVGEDIQLVAVKHE